jgi:conjugal transfer ATP-binding protein TraC
VLTNTLLTGFYSAHVDNHVVVIDDGGSYRRLCELLGGQYLEPTLDGRYAFNPFLAREHAFDKASRLDADFLSFVTLLVQLMVRRTDLTNNEKSIIQKCLLAAYAAANHTPVLGDLRAAFGRFTGDAQDTAIARDFYKNLELWTDGAYGALLNRQSSFDASARFLVFDLNKMTQEDLKPVVLLIIKSVIHPKLADKRLRKIIALDEVWKFLRERAGADLVTEWYKTGRRFNAAVSVITQSAEDLLRSAAAAAIGENSTVKWILNLGGGYDKLRELKITDEEVAAIKALGKNEERRLYRKVFLRFGERRRVIRNVLSPAAYWLYTSDPQDLRCEQELKAREPGWPAARVLRALAAMKEAHPDWRADDFLREIKAGRY